MMTKNHTYIVQNDTDEEVERDAEECQDGGTRVLWHVLRPHAHDGRPEGTHTRLEAAEGKHLHLTACSDTTPSWWIRLPVALEGTEKVMGECGHHGKASKVLSHSTKDFTLTSAAMEP